VFITAGQKISVQDKSCYFLISGAIFLFSQKSKRLTRSKESERRSAMAIRLFISPRLVNGRVARLWVVVALW
jgi:hypothetical protein